MKSQPESVVFGVHAVGRLIDAEPPRLRSLYLQLGRDDATIARFRDAAAASGVPVEQVSRERLMQITGSANHQGVAALVVARPLLDERALADLLDGIDNALLLVLDCVQDPHNLGACLRSAEAAGA
ncbi:MAG: 23S rRNA (guanosine(2251)-2'-O)-methyltransferase RlmB, partial [Gammaproteobacteria bacterium]|nr:23S rRNA (guanosine(2251)-2'-O)-methyltransferase RlmB [Gammaproteobacteria bacterium]